MQGANCGRIYEFNINLGEGEDHFNLVAGLREFAATIQKIG
jgi:hypothetical protein